MIRKSLAILCFVAALAALGLGVLSYWRGVPRGSLWISAVQTGPRLQAAMIGGTLHVVYSAPLKAPAATQAATRSARVRTVPVTPPDIDKRLAGFYARRRSTGTTVATGAGAPFWALFPVLIVPPAIGFLRGPLRRRRRRKRGLCLQCGYNLTGLSELRCPECGRPFALPAAA